MATSSWQLNHFERILFRIALVLGGVLITVRLAMMVVLWYVHYPR